MMFGIINNLNLPDVSFWTNIDQIEHVYTCKMIKFISKMETQEEREAAIFDLLFKVFHYFISECYTSQDRELLRSFLEHIDPVLRTFMIQNSKISTGLYLSVMEHWLATEHSNSEYFLKEMGLTKYLDEIKKIGFDETLRNSNILELTKISPDNVRSKHIVICVSGFLTEDVDKKESWRHIVNHYKHAEVFAMTWNSLSVSTLFNDGHYKDKKNGNSVLRRLRIIRTTKKQFKYCIK
jgi:hypothetical protein